MKPSQTAQFAAAHRAYHCLNDPAPVFQDEPAIWLLSPPLSTVLKVTPLRWLFWRPLLAKVGPISAFVHQLDLSPAPAGSFAPLAGRPLPVASGQTLLTSSFCYPSLLPSDSSLFLLVTAAEVSDNDAVMSRHTLNRRTPAP